MEFQRLRLKSRTSPQGLLHREKTHKVTRLCPSKWRRHIPPRRFFFTSKLPPFFREKINKMEETRNKKDVELVHSAAREAERTVKINNHTFKAHDSKIFHYNHKSFFDKTDTLSLQAQSHPRPSNYFGKPHTVTNGSSPMGQCDPVRF